MISWEIEIEIGEFDPRKEGLIEAISALREHMIGDNLKHTLVERRDGQPAVTKWGG